jgi:hypothetical protein
VKLTHSQGLAPSHAKQNAPAYIGNPAWFKLPGPATAAQVETACAKG